MGSIKWKMFGFLNKNPTDEEMETIFEKMSEQIAFKNLALFIGISYIANTLSKCEFKVFENGKETRNKLYYTLNVSPNPNENSSQFINKFVESYYYNGHALIVPQGDDIFCADSFHVDDMINPLKENTFDTITFGMQTLRKKMKSSDVFYFKLDNKNVKSLIDSLYAEYGQLISFAIKAFKRTNGAKYKYVLENYRAGDANFNNVYNESVRESLKSFLENDNGIFTQFKGTNLEEFSSKSPQSSADIIAMRKETFEVTAQALKIPLSMMYGNITNMNEIVKVYLSFCIDPLADMIGEEITRKYFDFDGWSEGNFVKVDTSCINHVDILEVANEIYNAVGSGIVNIDDMRNRLGWEPLNSEVSKQYFLSKNFVPADDMLNGTNEETPKGGE